MERERERQERLDRERLEQEQLEREQRERLERERQEQREREREQLERERQERLEREQREQREQRERRAPSAGKKFAGSSGLLLRSLGVFGGVVKREGYRASGILGIKRCSSKLEKICGSCSCIFLKKIYLCVAFIAWRLKALGKFYSGILILPTAYKLAIKC